MNTQLLFEKLEDGHQIVIICPKVISNWKHGKCIIRWKGRVGMIGYCFGLMMVIIIINAGQPSPHTLINTLPQTPIRHRPIPTFGPGCIIRFLLSFHARRNNPQILLLPREGAALPGKDTHGLHTPSALLRKRHSLTIITSLIFVRRGTGKIGIRAIRREKRKCEKSLQSLARNFPRRGSGGRQKRPRITDKTRPQQQYLSRTDAFLQRRSQSRLPENFPQLPPRKVQH